MSDLDKALTAEQQARDLLKQMDIEAWLSSGDSDQDQVQGIPAEQLAPLVNLIVEIERLRELLREFLDDGDELSSLTSKTKRLEAEIERLREERAMLISAKEITFAPPAIPGGFVIDELRKTIVTLHADIARLYEELAGADRIANSWAKQNIELRRLLRFFFENVPVAYHEGYADVMKKTDELLGDKNGG